jgi:fatty-acyl-CoA synthase
MHPQRTLVFHSLQVAKAFGLEAPGARLLAAVPFCGVYGFTSALGAFAGGAPIVMMETFDAAAAVALVRRHAVTHLFGSDEIYRRMLELAPGHDPFPSARVFGYAVFNPGGAELAREAWAKRVPLFGLYGSSEVQALFSIQEAHAPLERRIEAGGRPAAGALAQIRIRDVETGELLPPERSGEIEIRAPGNFTGYWNDAAATAEAVHADGFFRTGDIGRLREDGTFLYETRKGDAMRLGGYLVSPLEIEDALKGLPGVADVQVVAVEISGHARCVAFVIPAAPAPREAELLAAAARRMAAFKVPARVWFVGEFPTTESANGVKIQRGKLREMALERLRATPP